jgi:alkanesulfonate monooxygenase SsuD/methylene tetrahydromethanopterin reductase-like flavin-dependent oxidoreductase (luciferase family)
LGAGWQAREHDRFGFDLLDVPERFARFEEGLQVITRLLRDPGPVSVEGRYYHLKEAELLPRPARPGGPPIVIGGNGEKRTLPLTARFADEWNCVFTTLDEFTRLTRLLDDQLRQIGRAPSAVRRSMAQTLIFARDAAELDRLLADRDRAALRARGVIFGTADEVRAEIETYRQAGFQRLMLQWLALDDLDRLEAFAAQVLPHFSTP